MGEDHDVAEREERYPARAGLAWTLWLFAIFVVGLKKAHALLPYALSAWWYTMIGSAWSRITS